MQTEKPQTEKTQGMRFRNHISIIAEQTGGLLIALLIVLVPSLLENIDELMETGLEFMDGKWLLVNLGLILFFLVIIALQFAVWSKTYISLQDNAVVIERNTLIPLASGIFPILILSRISLRCSWERARSSWIQTAVPPRTARM